MKSSRIGFLLLVLLASFPVCGQRQRQPRLPGYWHENADQVVREFTFARLIYPSWSWRESWTTDYPKADHQFLQGLRGWVQSLLAISGQPVAVSMHDPKVFDYPFIYCVEPGGMELNENDAAALREYLLRGGFLMLDDFWGEREWQNVQYQMKKIFPEYEIQELPLTHPLFHCYFDIDEVVQVPNVGNWIYSRQTAEKGGWVPHYEAIVGDDGRVLVLIARNTDNGDAWEWIDEPQYALKFGLAAYRLGMNAIVYSMTH